MKTLHLTLNKKWFDMIASGEKKEEYREIKPYWIVRFCGDIFKNKSTHDFLEWYNNPPKHVTLDHVINTFNVVSANNGYSKVCPNIKWKHEGITIGEGKPEWGAEPGKKYFILKIGDLLCQ